jgi:hypothetical protein
MLASTIAFAALACNGKDLLDLGGDASTTEGGASSSGGNEDGGGGSGGSGGGGSGGAVTDASAVIVPGNTFPCGTNVCTPPDVCCGVVGAITPQASTCESAILCQTTIAQSCTDTTCPSGSQCCGTAARGDSGYIFGTTQCQEGTQCSPGTAPLCTPQVTTCPAGDFCAIDDDFGLSLCRPIPADGG